MDGLLQTENLVQRHVSQGNRGEAVKLLFELIVAYAKKKDFAKADVLREKLMEVDSMALLEIVKSGEIIQHEKSCSIDPDYLRVWSKLHSTLTSHESNALYYGMKRTTYEDGQFVMRQGARNSNLFLIYRGQLAMTFEKDREQIFLKNLGAGDIAGTDSFFYATVCTVSLMALTRTELGELQRSVLNKWQSEYPALESKLQDYCLQSERVHELLKNKGLDRRSQDRLALHGRAAVQILDSSGDPVGNPFRGELSDISMGGMSFVVGIQNKKTIQLLLGRSMNVKFPITVAGIRQNMEKKGIVVAVAQRPYEGYSVHVQFDQALPADFMITSVPQGDLT